MRGLDKSSDRIFVGKVPFDALNMSSAADRIVSFAKAKVGVPVRLSNAYCVALASSDAAYCELLNSPGLNLADGTPVAWFMRRWSRDPDSIGRVRGPSLFVELLDCGREHNLRHFFLGSTDATLKSMVSRAEKELPGISVAGYYAPPFGPLDGDFYGTAIKRVAASTPDILWIGLGTPKQDFACMQLADKLGIPCVGVGAAFDFYGRSVREAPPWVQDLGVEWLYRFGSEPRRLWKRYIFGNARFLGTTILQARRNGTRAHRP